MEKKNKEANKDDLRNKVIEVDGRSRMATSADLEAMITYIK